MNPSAVPARKMPNVPRDIECFPNRVAIIRRFAVS
jgi:hypothetical protein